MFFVDNGLDFASMSIACPFVYIETRIRYEMSIGQKIKHRPIRQLTIVNDSTTGRLGSVPERESTASKFGRFDAFHFTFANRSHLQ